jgi:hypothetical protein
VDIYDRKRNIPLEFKTSRASDIKEPKSFHVQQLKYYMAMLDVPQGYMLYQLLLHFGETPFKAFKITMNVQERKDQREKLVKEIKHMRRLNHIYLLQKISSARTLDNLKLSK